MSAEGGTAAAPRTRVPKARSVLWVAQWVAVVLVPAWLVGGTELVLPHSWAVIGMFFYAAALCVLLLVPAILSVAIGPTRRRCGGPYYVWLLLGAWACAAMLPFLAADLFEGRYTPSALERVGLAPSVDAVLYQSCFWGGAALMRWPGSPRSRQPLHGRSARVRPGRSGRRGNSSWSVSTSSTAGAPDPGCERWRLSRAAPGAGSRS